MKDDRIAIVTGGGTGIGRATAHELAKADNLVIVAERNGDNAAKVEAEIVAAGGKAKAIELDVTDGAALDRMVADLPHVNILVNNAGILSVRKFEDLRPEDYRALFDVNVIAVSEVTRRVVPKMPRGAAIVNISSRVIFGALNNAHYVASKSAVAGLNRAMALEFAGQGIRVNAVAPGVIKTAMLKVRDDMSESEFLKHQPLGYLGEPEDVAVTIAFLASPAARFITGQMLLIDGGRSLGGPYGF